MTRSSRDVSVDDCRTQRTRSLSPMRFQSVDVDPIWSTNKHENQSTYHSVQTYRKNDCFVASRTPESTPLPSRTLQQPLSALTESVSSVCFATLNATQQATNESQHNPHLHSPLRQEFNQNAKANLCSRTASSRTRTFHMNESFTQASSPSRIQGLNPSTKRAFSQCHSPFSQPMQLHQQTTSLTDSPLSLGMKRSYSEQLCSDDEAARVRAKLRSQGSKQVSPLMMSQPAIQSNNPYVSPFTSPLNSPFHSPLSSPLSGSVNQSNAHKSAEGHIDYAPPSKRARLNSSASDDQPMISSSDMNFNHQNSTKHSIFLSPYSSPASSSDNSPTNKSVDTPSQPGTPASSSSSINQSVKRSVNLSIVLPNSPASSVIHSPVVQAMATQPIYHFDDNAFQLAHGQPHDQLNDRKDGTIRHPTFFPQNFGMQQSNHQAFQPSVPLQQPSVQSQPSMMRWTPPPPGQSLADRWYHYQQHMKKQQQQMMQAPHQPINQHNNRPYSPISIDPSHNETIQQPYHNTITPYDLAEMYKYKLLD